MRVINTILVRRMSSKCIKIPVPFHLVPYDEQYETRDFKRNVTSYPSLFKEELEELDILHNDIQKHKSICFLRLLFINF
jgi:hypothetical protein